MTKKYKYYCIKTLNNDILFINPFTCYILIFPISETYHFCTQATYAITLRRCPRPFIVISSIVLPAVVVRQHEMAKREVGILMLRGSQKYESDQRFLKKRNIKSPHFIASIFLIINFQHTSSLYF